MAYGNIKQLASYTLHATESIVYTAPVSKSVEVASMWLHNRSATTMTVNMWFPYPYTTPTASFSASLDLLRLSEGLSGSVSLEIAPKVPFVLNSAAGAFNDKITMKATQSSSVNVTIYGREDV